jgi:hypothetical protein
LLSAAELICLSDEPGVLQKRTTRPPDGIFAGLRRITCHKRGARGSKEKTADPAHLVKRVVDKSGGLEFGFTLCGNQHTQRE